MFLFLILSTIYYCILVQLQSSITGYAEAQKDMIYLCHRKDIDKKYFIKAPAHAERVYLLFSYLEFVQFLSKVNNSFNINFFGASFKSLESDQMFRINTSTGFSRFYNPT